MNWYTIFYIVTVGDKFNSVLFWTGLLTVVMLLITTGIFLVHFLNTEPGYYTTSIIVLPDGSKREETSEEVQRKAVVLWQKRWLHVLLFSMIVWVIYCAIPTRKEALLIVAAGGVTEFLTSDSSARQLPHELSSFLLTELKDLGLEAKNSATVNEVKQDLLNKARTMPFDSLRHQMQVDSNFAKLILGK